MSKEKEIRIAFDIYDNIGELSSEDKALCLEAEKALETSHSPYSSFSVGAALQLQSGKIIHGSNQENVAYPSGLCAERVALFTFGANYPGETIKTLAVTAHTVAFALSAPITPCGACLQVLAEYEKKQNQEIDVLLYCLGGVVWKAKGIKSFLPFLFFENRLNQ